MNKPIKKLRHVDWNYGGAKWRLSRSKIDLFIECPRCFYMDNKLGIKRPDMPGFLLNSAVDILLKKEFDIHRAKGEAHPLMKTYKIDAVPFVHPDMDTWRENFEGVEFFHQETGFRVCGAIDDLWINSKEELHVVDYKSTSKDEEITLEDKWKQGYKRQMEVYQWLLRQNGFTVSEIAYFVYANGITDRKAFDGKLEFDVTIIPYDGNPSWVEDTLFQIKEALDKPEAPEPASDCDHCLYFYTREKNEENNE